MKILGKVLFTVLAVTSLSGTALNNAHALDMKSALSAGKSESKMEQNKRRRAAEQKAAHKKDEIQRLEKRLGWIERTKKSEQAEKYYTEMEEGYARLEKDFPGDRDVINSKNRYLPKAQKARDRLVGGNKAAAAKYRMPKDRYFRGDKKSVRAHMSRLFYGKYKNKVIRVTIPMKSWEKRKEKVYKNNRVVYRSYEVIKAFLATMEGGRHYVYEINFRRDGSRISFYGFVGKQAILKKNINK